MKLLTMPFSYSHPRIPHASNCILNAFNHPSERNNTPTPQTSQIKRHNLSTLGTGLARAFIPKQKLLQGRRRGKLESTCNSRRRYHYRGPFHFRIPLTTTSPQARTSSSSIALYIHVYTHRLSRQRQLAERWL